VVIKAKYDAAGRFQKVKARIVANSAQQNRELYDFISAPTVDPEDVMMTLAIAAKYKYFVATMDIGGAYLNASMVDEVYVEFSPLLSQYILSVCPQYASFLHQNKLYVQLDRALYGCIQSARLWYNTIAKFLLEIGFTKSLTDECVFHIQFNQQKMIVTISVDDLLIVASAKELIGWLHQQLCEKFIEVTFKDGNELSYLGMNERSSHHFNETLCERTPP
jgi:hypothetical protein